MQDYYWLILGITLIIKDSLLFNSVFVLIFGISALILAALVATNLVASSDYVAQLSIFVILSVIFLIVIFIKRKVHTSYNFNDIVGNKAVVLEKIADDLEGKLRWSGTIVKAKISSKSSKFHYEIGEEVVIDSVKGNIFYIKEVK